LSLFQEALDLLDPGKDPGFYGVVLHDLAEIHEEMGNRAAAATRYRESIKCKLRANNPSDLATTLQAFADFLVDGDETSEAHTVLDQLRQLLTASEPTAVRRWQLGRTYERLGNRDQPDAYPEALHAYRQALDLLDPTTEPGSYATVLADIGDVHKAQDQLEESATAYQQAIEHMRRQPNSEPHIARMLLKLGRVRHRMTPQDAHNSADNNENHPGVQTQT
jgi:tetratricopeptide (TPR) repeat protein